MRDLFKLINDYPLTSAMVGVFILILVKEITSIFKQN
jgi:hypothetical protein